MQEVVATQNRKGEVNTENGGSSFMHPFSDLNLHICFAIASYFQNEA